METRSLDNNSGDYLQKLALKYKATQKKSSDGKYPCPVCNGDNFSVGQDGLFTCYTNESTLHREEVGRYLHQTFGQKRETIRAIPWTKKPLLPFKDTYYFYPDRNGNKLIRVKKYFNNDKQIKSFSQEHWDGKKWVNGYGTINKTDIPLYRYQEIRKAIANGKTIFIVEGESCADALWKLGIATTCNITGSGGTWGEHWVQDLRDDSGVLCSVVLCPDRDKKGVDHVTKIHKLIPSAKFLYAKPDKEFWAIIPASGGYDIANWIEDGATGDDVLAAIEDNPRPIMLEGENRQSKKIVQLHPEKAEVAIRPEIKKIFESEASEPDKRLSLGELSSASHVPIATIKDYYDSLKKDVEDKESFTDLDKIAQLSALDLDIRAILPSWISDPIIKTAAAVPTAPEALLTCMLPMWASAIGTSSRIVINRKSKYIQPAILRTMIVGKTGDRKTPILDIATEAIEILEREVQEQNEKKRLQYKSDLTAWESADKKSRGEKPEQPIMMSFMEQDINFEGLMKAHSANPRGLLIKLDELFGYFTRMNKQSGKGDDKERDLTLYNGGSGKKTRQSSELNLYLPRTAVSICGGIQWEKLIQLQKMEGGDDSAGTLSRFLVCGRDLPLPYLDLLSDDDEDFGLTEINQQIFKSLRNLKEQDYLLSPDAKKAFQAWQHDLVDKMISEPIMSMRNAYPKFEGSCARLALVLHLVWYCGDVIEPVISSETIKRAIILIDWFMGQQRYCLAKTNTSESEILRVKELLERKQTLTASQVRQYDRPLKSAKDDHIHSIFNVLVASGFAEEIKSKTKKIGVVPRQGQTKLDKKAEVSGSLNPSDTNGSRNHQNLTLDNFRQDINSQNDYVVSDSQVELDNLDKNHIFSGETENHQDLSQSKSNQRPENITNLSGLSKEEPEPIDNQASEVSEEASKKRLKASKVVGDDQPSINGVEVKTTLVKENPLDLVGGVVYEINGETYNFCWFDKATSEYIFMPVDGLTPIRMQNPKPVAIT